MMKELLSFTKGLKMNTHLYIWIMYTYVSALVCVMYIHVCASYVYLHVYVHIYLYTPTCVYKMKVRTIIDKNYSTQICVLHNNLY